MCLICFIETLDWLVFCATFWAFDSLCGWLIFSRISYLTAFGQRSPDSRCMTVAQFCCSWGDGRDLGRKFLCCYVQGAWSTSDISELEKVICWTVAASEGTALWSWSRWGHPTLSRRSVGLAGSVSWPEQGRTSHMLWGIALANRQRIQACG